MSKLKTYLFILLGGIVFSPLFGFAQNTKEEVIKINEVFQGLKKYSMEVEIINYTDNKKDDINANANNITVYKKDGDLLYIKQYHAETILNKECALNIDHVNKFIILSPRDKAKAFGKNDLKSFNENIPLIIDSTFKLYENISLKKISETSNEIVFEYKKGRPIKNVAVKYNPATHIIQSMSVTYAKPMKQGEFTITRSEMKYKNFVLNPVFDKTLFSEKTYVNYIKRKPVLNKKYSDYQLVNKLTKS